MRLLIVFLLLLFVLLGAAFSALNGGLVHYDLLIVQTDLPKGVALMLALIVGWLLGGLTAWVGLGLAQRRRARAQRTEADSGIGSA